MEGILRDDSVGSWGIRYNDATGNTEISRDILLQTTDLFISSYRPNGIDNWVKM